MEVMRKVNLATHHDRAKFIREAESGIYLGRNENEELVVILLQKGEGMTVRTINNEKPDWFEVIEYDAHGEQESVAYEFIGKEKGRLN